MNLILLIVIGFVMWLAYLLYTAYDNIVKELKEIRTKCVGEKTSPETFQTNIKENPVNEQMKALPSTMATALQLLLKTM